MTPNSNQPAVKSQQKLTKTTRRNAGRIIASLGILVVNCIGCLSASAQSLNTYHIGNSLTWDARITDALPILAQDAGLQLTTGYHIRCSQPLSYIATHPDPNDTCITPNSFGGYTEAFAEHAWDAITLQPHSLGTPRQEYMAFKSLVQLARQNPDNLNTRFYLYANWPVIPQPGVTFFDSWHDPTPVDPDADLIRNANGFKWIFDQLKTDPDLQDVDLRTIPAGDVLAELDLRMRAGLIPGYLNAKSLYRDAVHMNKLGQFAIASTFLATLFEQDTTGTPANSKFNLFMGQPQSTELTTELTDAVHEAIWYVISQHLLPGDVNADGFVGIEDLNTILPFWNQTTATREPQPGDLDADGFVGITDLTTVINNWNQNVTPGDLSAGDFNADGFVGNFDLNAVLSNWNQTTISINLQDGDQNRDGFIGINDLSTVLSNWNTGSPPNTSTTIPEPTTASLLATCAATLTYRRKYRRPVHPIHHT